MNAMNLKAACARPVGAAGLFGSLLLAFALSACSVLPKEPATPAVYDFGLRQSSANTPADRRAPLPALLLADINTSGMPDESTSLLYRLAYDNSQHLRPYGLARWSLPPAQLLQQRLRDELSQRRPVLLQSSSAAQIRADGKTPPILRIELEEFSQVFSSATQSAGVIHARASLVQPSPAGEILLAYRAFDAQSPAPSANAAGGAAALAQASGDLAQQVTQWLDQIPPAR